VLVLSFRLQLRPSLAVIVAGTLSGASVSVDTVNATATSVAVAFSQTSTGALGGVTVTTGQTAWGGRWVGSTTVWGQSGTKQVGARRKTHLNVGGARGQA
jgi:hypothetical protein